MSVEAVTARVSQLQTLVDQAQRAGRPQVMASGSFGALLTAQGIAAPAPVAPAAAPGLAPLAGPAAPTGAPFTASSANEAQFGPVVDEAARRNGVDPALLRALVRQESGFDPAARSPAGATGLGQLMPGTAAGLGVTNPLDPAQSADGAARYLKAQLQTFGGDVQLALAAYNAGPGAVQRHGGVPPFAETQQYVARVTAFADQYRSGGIR